MKATYNTPENLANKVMNAAELLAALEIPTQENYCHRDFIILPEAWPAFRDEIAAAGVEIRGDVSEYRDKTIKEYREKFAGLVVPGVSELVIYYRVSASHDWRPWNDIKPRICSIEGATPYLLIGGRAYLISDCNGVKRGKPVALYLPGHLALDAYRAGWDFKESEPQKVGKATAKKLAAWVDYLDRKNASAAAYLKRGEDAAAALFAQLDAAGVEYMRNGDKVTIYNGPFKMVVEVTKSGVYYNRPEVDLSEVCKLAAAARPDLPDSRLAFMLNAKINITF